mmetsp:Transcript_16061/g.36884  ORF Transcript_16061/g.36884 Transcript_16061/m.36884 type:complete len:487 (-) Transcript_16061:48-1508(-)
MCYRLHGLLCKLVEHVRHAASASLALKGLVVLVGDGHSEEDAGSAAASTDEVREDREQADGHAANEGRGGHSGAEGVTEVLVGAGWGELPALVSLASRHLDGVLARHPDPHVRKETARDDDEGDVKEHLEGVDEDGREGGGGGDVVREAASGARVALGVFGPRAEEGDDGVAAEAAVEDLEHKVQVGHEGGLEDDGHVARVKELDVEIPRHVAARLVLELKGDLPPLEVDDNDRHDDGGDEVGNVGEGLAVESVTDGGELVGASEEHVEQGDDGAMELGATADVERRGAEGVPHNGLAHVGRDEERDGRTESVSLLEQVIEHHDDETGEGKLEDDQDGVDGTKIGNVSVHSREDVGHSLGKDDDEGEELLGGVEEATILVSLHRDLDETSTLDELHDGRGSHDGGDTQLHEGPSVRGHDHAKPVKWIGGALLVDAVKRHLRAHQKDKQASSCPHQSLKSRDSLALLRSLDVRDEAHHRLDKLDNTE